MPKKSSQIYPIKVKVDIIVLLMAKEVKFVGKKIILNFCGINVRNSHSS